MDSLRVVFTSVTLATVTLAVFARDAAAVDTYPKLPNNYVPCYRNDPKFNECFQKSLQHLFNTFTKPGIPEFDLEPLEPLLVPNVIVNYNLFDVKSKIIISNLTFLGYNGVQIGKIRSNFTNSRDKFNMDVSTYFPRLIIQGHYVANGSFLELKVNGKGNFNISLARVNGTQKLTGAFVELDGREHVTLDYVDFRPRIGHLKLYGDDLFTGNKVLSDTTLLAVNLFWRVFYDLALKDDLSKSWGGVSTSLLNKVFKHLPYDVMFPLRTVQIKDYISNKNSVVFNKNRN